jgi:hypothetical protein
VISAARGVRARPWLAVMLALVVCAGAALIQSEQAGAENCNTSGVPHSQGGNCIPQAHWSDGNGSQAWVTLIDNTGSNWLVYAAAIEWDYAGRIDIIYRSSDCGGYGHCVSVNNSHFSGYTCHERPGYVAPSYSNGHFDGDTVLRLNQDCVGNGWGDRDRRVITCQEEGHVAGVGHSPPSTHNETCMAWQGLGYDIDDWRAFPRHHDFVWLDEDIYTHND